LFKLGLKANFAISISLVINFEKPVESYFLILTLKFFSTIQKLFIII
jgi:hypothetical protein